jgi:hypothetical protein
MYFMSIELSGIGGNYAPYDDAYSMKLAGAALYDSVRDGQQFQGVVAGLEGDTAVLTLPGEHARDEPVAQVRLIAAPSGALVHVRNFIPTDSGRTVVEHQYGTRYNSDVYQRDIWEEDKTMAGFDEIPGSRQSDLVMPLEVTDCRGVVCNIIDEIQVRATR